MSHANAALTPRHPQIVAHLVIDEGWPISEVAARLQLSWPTVKRWVDRYRAGQSMQDLSSRPPPLAEQDPSAAASSCAYGGVPQPRR